MIEINNRKYDKLLTEVAVNLHFTEKLLNEFGGVNDDVTASEFHKAREVAIHRYREDMLFNRRVTSMIHSVIGSLDIRVTNSK